MKTILPYLCLFASVQMAQSAIIITVTEAVGGANIVISGSIDLSGFASPTGSGSLGSNFNTQGNNFYFGNGTGGVNAYAAILSGDAIPDMRFDSDSTLPGGTYGYNTFIGNTIIVPDDYISGTHINRSGFQPGAIFGAGLLSDGIEAIATIPTATGTDSIIFRTGVSPIPEPTNVLAMSLIMSLGLMHRRK